MEHGLSAPTQALHRTPAESASASGIAAFLEEASCELCGCADSRVLFAKQETRSWWHAKCDDDPRLDRHFAFPLVRCAECRHVFVSPRLRRDVNGDIYASYWSKPNPESPARADYLRYVPTQLAALHPLGDLLDFGCGWGAQLRAAAVIGWRATGIEVDSHKVAFCRKGGLRSVAADLLDRPFAAATFDAAIADQVFEHLYSPADYLSELQRTLRPGGVLYVSVPNRRSVQARLKGRRWDLIHPVSHVRYFARSDLERLMKRCGFTIETPAQIRRFHGRPLKSAAHAAKLLLERKLRYYVRDLTLYGRKLPSARRS